jgi:O-antigen/teichoic acid export membrane protein
MTSLFKNTSIYTIGNVLPKATGFILLPIYTKYMTPSDYGIYSSMQTLGAMLIIAFTLAVDMAIYRIYFDYDTESEKKNYLGTMAITIAGISLTVLVLLFIFHNSISNIYRTIEFYPYYVYAIMLSYFSIFSIIPKIYLQVNQKAIIYIILSLGQFLINTSFILWFMIVEKQGAAGVLKGVMYANLLTLPINLFITLKVINITFKYDMFRASIKFSLPQIPILLSAWIMNLSDRIFIERFFSLQDVGIYSLGYKIGEAVLIISTAFSLAYSPIYFSLANSNNQIEAKKRLHRYNSSFTITMVFITFLVAVFSRDAVEILVDEKYIEAINIVPIISLAYLVLQVGGLLNLSIYQEKKTLQLMYLSIGSAIINILMNYYFISLYGSYGAAVSTLISFTIFFLLKYWYSKKCYFIPFEWRNITIATVTLFVMYILLDQIVTDYRVLSILIKMIISIILGYIIYKKFFLNRIVMY